MSSVSTATVAAVSPPVVPETTAEEAETKTYWCHECDMSVALSSSSSSSSSTSSSSSSSSLLCPHCHTHFLELMDSPLFPQSDSLSSLFDTPFLHHLIQHHLIPSDDEADGDTDLGQNENDDVVSEDPLSLSFPFLSAPRRKSLSESLPTILVTSSLLSQIDQGGFVLCAICKDSIAIDAEAKQLPCKHLYHSDCITPWLDHHNSCPLCRFQLAAAAGEQEEEGVSQARRIRRQLRNAMMRLSELMEEEDDFYGLRTTLNHIASRHGVLPSDSSLPSSQTTEVESDSIVSVGSNGNLDDRRG